MGPFPHHPYSADNKTSITEHKTVVGVYLQFVCDAGFMTKRCYLPVKVKSLQQLYPALSGWHTVRRNRLHQLRAHRDISKHQQSSDGKPAPKPRMHTHSKHFLKAKGSKDHSTQER